MKRKFSAVAAGLMLAAPLMATPALAADTATAGSNTDPQVLAKAAAGRLIASRAPALKLAHGDKVGTPTLYQADGFNYVAYERTHRGLPVVGGDFVVVANKLGKVLNTSVAQTKPIAIKSLRPKVSLKKAIRLARVGYKDAGNAKPAKVIYARGGAPRLAWQLQVTGVRKGADAADQIWLNARTGKVIKRESMILHGTGTGGTNGPNPLSFTTTQSGGNYSMKSTRVPGLQCEDFNTKSVLTGPDDVWGNGNRTSIETACVDALYGSEQMDGMLSSWLGRDGAKGDGSAWPMLVGWRVQNAQYCQPGVPWCSDSRNHLEFGFNGSGQWLTVLDVVAHESGHGVDDFTPGGISRGNTQEFVADVFGTMTEYFDNQSADYDAPDYLIGEEAGLGSGPIRNMYNPSALGHPNCYSSSTESAAVHAAAGPGNHWFYLLAEGTNPGGGKPSSTTCNGSTLTGIGIQAAGKIFYNAMLMKNSSSNYRAYRTWTLAAAKNLDPTCVQFNKVKAAWDAVTVPAQSADPTCTAGTPSGVTVTDPGDKTGTVGSPISGFSMAASGGTSPYTWSATGLPGGVSMTSAGVVSGTPTAAGTFNVTATATDAAGQQGSTQFTVTINPSGGGGGGGQILANPGFESGAVNWSGTSGPVTNNAGKPARTGSWKLWLGGNGRSTSETINQTVTIPATATSARLSYWIRTDTNETGNSVYDRMSVQVVSGGLATTLKSFSNVGTNSTYTQYTHDLTSYKGKSVTIRFTATEDSSLQTSFVVDDTALTVS